MNLVQAISTTKFRNAIIQLESVDWFSLDSFQFTLAMFMCMPHKVNNTLIKVK